LHDTESLYTVPILPLGKIAVMSGSILLVDNDPDSLTVLKTILDNEGYTTYAATNFEDAISACKKHEVELAIIDFLIPGCRGDLMASIFKFINKHLEIIFLSDYEGVYKTVDKLNFPVYGIFMKTENIDELLFAIENIFSEENEPDQRNTPHKNMIIFE
jgi:DNA-binding NtrC family response regulator